MKITAGGDFLGLCDQKSSHKHVSDFRRLWSYGHFFNSRTRPRVNRVLRNQLAGYVLNLVTYRLLQLQRATRAVHNSAAACVGGRRWHFRKPALSKDKFKLKAISRIKLYIYSLNISCIMLVYYFVPFIVNNRYLLF